MAEPVKSGPSTKPAFKPAAKPGAGGGDFDVELIILIFIIGFLILGISGSVLDSFSALSQNIYVYRFILTLKIISGTVAALSIMGIVYVLSKSLKLRHEHLGDVPQSQVSSEPVAHPFALEWSGIHSRLDTATDVDAALIIIDADALADRILKELKLPGETMGERLIALGEQKFKAIDDLWDAHKIRNQIAHEGAKNITYSDAAYALAKYEKAFKELGVI